MYGFEEGGRAPGTPTVQALVMELVESESLATRLERPSTVAQGVPSGVEGRGPLPLREALELARQIADGLEAAHEKGIVHRDLKPANVQVTPDGQAKILDFGLAKATAPEEADDVTLTSPAQLTQHGIVLGTAAYMSHEQARGLPVDPRTDVWAFGALLFEMLTGTRPFPGPTVTDLLAQILERDPDWTKLPAATPGSVSARPSGVTSYPRRRRCSQPNGLLAGTLLYSAPAGEYRTEGFSWLARDGQPAPPTPGSADSQWSHLHAPRLAQR